jgi:hypothetical protein
MQSSHSSLLKSGRKATLCNVRNTTPDMEFSKVILTKNIRFSADWEDVFLYIIILIVVVCFVYNGASEAYNLCIVCGEIRQLFRHKFPNTFREKKQSLSITSPESTSFYTFT